MRINYNVSAMLANNTLTNSNTALSKSIQRLSSGLKINNAKDNPAGLAMAKRMNGQIVGTGVAKMNTNDGISVIETTDGALNEVHEMLHRMTELATQAINGTNTDDDRRIIQEEIDELKKEIDNISKNTQFNSQNLLDGSFDYKAYTSQGAGVAPKIKVSTYNSVVQSGDYKIDTISWAPLGDGSGRSEVTAMTLSGLFPDSDLADYNVSMVDNYVSISHKSGFEMTFEIDPDLVFADDISPETVAGTVNDVEIECTGIGPMRLQTGSNEGHVVSVEIPAVSLGNLGISRISVENQDYASDALDRIKGAVQFVSSVRGKLGAYQNRLESTSDNLGVIEENMTSAYSRIMDVDMAEEMTQYSTQNVIVQAGTSVLAQANERPSMVLQLLQ